MLTADGAEARAEAFCERAAVREGRPTWSEAPTACSTPGTIAPPVRLSHGASARRQRQREGLYALVFLLFRGNVCELQDPFSCFFATANLPHLKGKYCHGDGGEKQPLHVLSGAVVPERGATFDTL